METSGIYAGWVVINVHLLIFLSLMSLGLSTIATLLLLRKRPWHAYISLFVTLFVLFFAISWLISDLWLTIPLIRERHFFPIDPVLDNIAR